MKRDADMAPIPRRTSGGVKYLTEREYGKGSMREVYEEMAKVQTSWKVVEELLTRLANRCVEKIVVAVIKYRDKEIDGEELWNVSMEQKEQFKRGAKMYNDDGLVAPVEENEIWMNTLTRGLDII